MGKALLSLGMAGITPIMAELIAGLPLGFPLPSLSAEKALPHFSPTNSNVPLLLQEAVFGLAQSELMPFLRAPTDFCVVNSNESHRT